MCGRIFQSSPPADLGLGLVDGLEAGFPAGPEHRPRYNGAPGQDLLVIRRTPDGGGHTLSPLRWGLIPSWAKTLPKPPPINARAETVARLPTFRAAYAKRRCLFPIDGFYEWARVEGARTKQPYAIALESRRPFALAGLWENWRDPETDAWTRTFCVITCQANSLVGDVHDRMPVILEPETYDRWLGDEADPSDLLKPFPPEPMTLWPVSTRVNRAGADEAGLLNSL